MAILIIEQQRTRQAGTLMGRVLIGRWPELSVVIDDRAVSRIHAWIGLLEGRYYIADAGSRTGTFVNGEALRERHLLVDGDQIRIGPAVLRYRTDPAPPVEITEIDLSPRSPAELSGEHGVFMDCICGAPLWLPRQFAGIGQCRYCGHTVTQGMEAPAAANPPARKPSAAKPKPARPAAKSPAPIPTAGPPARYSAAPPRGAPAPSDDQEGDGFNAAIDDALADQALAIRTPPPAERTPRQPSLPAAPAARKTSRRATTGAVPVIPPAASDGPSAPSPLQPPMPAAAKAEVERICGVCHSPITLFDDVQECPSCNLAFHVDCWQENRGCSAYGCAHVGALAAEDGMH